jgi:N6-adenosine-specific RNA methylase IME4
MNERTTISPCIAKAITGEPCIFGRGHNGRHRGLAKNGGVVDWDKTSGTYTKDDGKRCGILDGKNGKPCIHEQGHESHHSTGYRTFPNRPIKPPKGAGKPSALFGVSTPKGEEHLSERTRRGAPKILGYPRHPAAALYPMLEDDELAALAEDIHVNGLRDPIVLISEGGKESILDGSNRGKACELAKVKPRYEYYSSSHRGMDALIAYVVSKNDKRRHLSVSVRALIAADAAQLCHGQRQSGKLAGVATQVQAAKQQRVSERSVRGAVAVRDKGTPKVRDAVMKGKLAIDAAALVSQLPPAKQNEIADRVLAKNGETRSGHVRALAKQEQKRAVVAKINQAQVRPMPTGPFRLIAIDPPWPYENSDQHEGSRGHITYPPMPMEAICMLRGEINRVAHDDVILALWVTNAFIHVVGAVLGAWGFEHRSMITWDKGHAGVGSWPRGKTEHLVIASRGKPVHTLNEITTLIRAPTREHSRKPDEIMDLLAKHCPGPHLEMFAREPRTNWAVWGAETQKFAARDAA